MATATPYQQLEQEFRRLHAFRGVLALLRWDAAITMPRASADVRGDQVAALEIETHTLLVSPRISRLLDRADANAQSLAGWQAANLREMRRLHDHAIATPQSLIARMAKAIARSEARWREAREANDFNVLAPQLEETVKLVRSKAELLGQRFSLDPWDALADEFTPGLLSRDIEACSRRSRSGCRPRDRGDRDPGGRRRHCRSRAASPRAGSGACAPTS